MIRYGEGATRQGAMRQVWQAGAQLKDVSSLSSPEGLQDLQRDLAMTCIQSCAVNSLNFHFPVAMWSLISLLRNRAADCKVSLADAVPLANVMVREGWGRRQPCKWMQVTPLVPVGM